MRARLLVPVVLSAAALGCGETLVDHRAPDLFAPPETITTIVQGACNTVDACGASCSPCPSPTGLTVNAGSAVRACYETSPVTTCDYQCTGGLIKCAGGCCTATRVAAGEAHTCAITDGGALYCWGWNGSGQVAAGAGANVIGPRGIFSAGVTEVALGVEHTCAIVGASVACWGRNLEGQAPPAVPGVTGATRLAAGLAHTCAIVTGGAVKCWGSEALGQRGGAGSGTPAVATPIASGATSISAGYDHTCAVLGSGAVKCWGSRSKGQLGDGTAAAAGTFSPDPVAATSITAATAIAAGRDHTCSAQPSDGRLTVDPAVQCWGDEPGPTFLLASPQLVPAVPLRTANRAVIAFDVARIVTGRTHTCVQRTGELAYCFGPDNASGQLGNTPPAPGTESAPVTGSLAALDLTAGADHSCAVFAGGVIRCWGLNDHGQLGDGTTTTPPVGVYPNVSGR